MPIPFNPANRGPVHRDERGTANIENDLKSVLFGWQSVLDSQTLVKKIKSQSS